MRVLEPQRVVSYLQQIRSDDPRVVAGGNHAVPWQLLELVDKALPRFRLFMLNAPAGVPCREGITLETPFVGAGMRGQAALAYFPSRLSLVPALLKRRLVPDVVLLHVTPPRHGVVSMSVEVNVLPAAVEAAHAAGGLVIAQVNPQLPFTGGDALLSVDEIDLALEASVPLDASARHPASEVQRVIGEHVAELVPDGATLQLGIGAIPDATLDALRRRRGLRIWSEMISDGVMHLARAGHLADERIRTSFAAGTAEFYAWLDGNDLVEFSRTERTNDPAVIARQPAMTSINAALQVDLFAQANASYARGRIYSGFGGQTDFVVGALHAPNGRAIIALPSWHQGSESSTIVDRLCCPATSFQHSNIVTENGCAQIWGRPQREQALELIAHAAAPMARDQLEARLADLF